MRKKADRVESAGDDVSREIEALALGTFDALMKETMSQRGLSPTSPDSAKKLVAGGDPPAEVRAWAFEHREVLLSALDSKLGVHIENCRRRLRGRPTPEGRALDEKFLRMLISQRDMLKAAICHFSGSAEPVPPSPSNPN
jgi:hypothetical protein